MLRLSILLAAILAVTLPATASSPSEVVRLFYDPANSETDPALRDRFVDPARARLDENEAVADTGELGCIDFALAYDAQDLDDGEVARTLVLDEEIAGDSATVVARFTLFPDEPESAREIEWTLHRVSGDWKIADIRSRENDWRLGAFDCSP